jgi:dephospho-CoA kinase
MPLDQSHIIIGFTGPIGSGCTYAAKALSETHPYKYYKLSDVIRDHLSGEDKDTKNVELLQSKGNELRETKGPSCIDL